MKAASYRVALGSILLQLMVSQGKAAEEMSEEIIAAQIREQGHACDKALSAERLSEKLAALTERGWPTALSGAWLREHEPENQPRGDPAESALNYSKKCFWRSQDFKACID